MLLWKYFAPSKSPALYVLNRMEPEILNWTLWVPQTYVAMSLYRYQNSHNKVEFLLNSVFVSPSKTNDNLH